MNGATKFCINKIISHGHLPPEVRRVTHLCSQAFHLLCFACVSRDGLLTAVITLPRGLVLALCWLPLPLPLLLLTVHRWARPPRDVLRQVARPTLAGLDLSVGMIPWGSATHRSQSGIGMMCIVHRHIVIPYKGMVHIDTFLWIYRLYLNGWTQDISRRNTEICTIMGTLR